MRAAFLIALICTSLMAQAQNIRTLLEEDPMPKAGLKDMAWMEGHWQGKALGGTTEEIWSPALGGSMMFSFRLIKDGKVTFYELGHVVEYEGSLLFQLKHFGADLHGWEAKDETEDFKLVSLEEGKLYFDGLTLERNGPDAITIYVLMEHKNGSTEELAFPYKRVP